MRTAYKRIRGFPYPRPWNAVLLRIDAQYAGEVVPPLIKPVVLAIDPGLHHFEVLPEGNDGIVEPVSLDVPANSRLLIYVRPAGYRFLSGHAPTVSYQLLP